jgi:hypothetical protein
MLKTYFSQMVLLLAVVTVVAVFCVSYVLRQKKQLSIEHMIQHSRTR